MLTIASSSARNSSLRAATRSRSPPTSIGRTLACVPTANHGRGSEMREARGVVVSGLGAPARIEPIVVDDPGPGEVLVRLVANGVCHSDLWSIQHGNWGSPFPMLLGHEGAGVVEMVGDGVIHVGQGDRVLLAWAVPC